MYPQILTNKQTMELAMLGKIEVNGRKLFKWYRFDSVLQAEEKKQNGDVVVQNNTSVFILNPFPKN